MCWERKLATRVRQQRKLKPGDLFPEGFVTGVAAFHDLDARQQFQKNRTRLSAPLEFVKRILATRVNGYSGQKLWETPGKSKHIVIRNK
jgi:hypothetical protein